MSASAPTPKARAQAADCSERSWHSLAPAVIAADQDYYQTEWPRRTRAYEYGVYTDQVLQTMFMPGMHVLTNLSPN